MQSYIFFIFVLTLFSLSSYRVVKTDIKTYKIVTISKLEKLDNLDKWWMYFTPHQAAQFYRSPTFNKIKIETDKNYLNGLKTSQKCLKADIERERELRRGIELLSVTYFSLKHGKYGGNPDPNLNVYLDNAKKLWLKVVNQAPANKWTDSFDGKHSGSTCKNKTGWYEGDITFRKWLSGAIPSYNMIRADLPTRDRRKIDTWMRDIAAQMWNDRSFPFKHNRGVSRYGQAHLIALVLQDNKLFETYFHDSERGFKNKFSSFFNFAPNPPCNKLIETNLKGLTWEHTYKTGVYGRTAIAQFLDTVSIIAFTAQNGGNKSWDYTKTTKPDFLKEMWKTWYSFATKDRKRYINWSHCLEHNKFGQTQTNESNLNDEFWFPFALRDRRFLKVKIWGTDDGISILRRYRAENTPLD
ncbi:MAG: hypothetical protein AAF378_22640 [Cyanobacteria bacterium P01_A01_bin.84]